MSVVEYAKVRERGLAGDEQWNLEVLFERNIADSEMIEAYLVSISAAMFWCQSAASVIGDRLLEI